MPPLTCASIGWAMACFPLLWALARRIGGAVTLRTDEKPSYRRIARRVLGERRDPDDLARADIGADLDGEAGDWKAKPGVAVTNDEILASAGSRWSTGKAASPPSQIRCSSSTLMSACSSTRP